jgi:hypothetical protein
LNEKNQKAGYQEEPEGSGIKKGLRSVFRPERKTVRRPFYWSLSKLPVTNSQERHNKRLRHGSNTDETRIDESTFVSVFNPVSSVAQNLVLQKIERQLMTPPIPVRASASQAFCLKPQAYHYLLLMAIFAQNNCTRLFGRVETRLKMTFHSRAEDSRATRRLCKPLSKTPLLFFHYENVFRKKGKTISIQTDPNRITTQREFSSCPNDETHQSTNRMNC